MGDYTRSLAEEAQRQGTRAILIGLNDRWLEPDSAAVSESSQSRLDQVPARRFPASAAWKKRIAEAGAVLTDFDPDWVSLQFVCYGFHPRGLVHGLARRLRPLLNGRKSHLMFHELWIGGHAGAAIKERFLGLWQRHCVLKLVRSLRPHVVHTSNPTYRALLKKYGIPGTVLPLFSSIPVVERPDRLSIIALLNEAGARIDPAGARSWIFGFFGSVPPLWPPEPLFSLIQQAAVASERQVTVASIGRLGPGEALWSKLRSRYNPPFSFVKLGEQPAAVVSGFLQTIDFAVSATPWNLTGKSSSVAAMLEHGVPVIVNRPPLDYHLHGVNENASSLLVPMNEDLPVRLPALRQHQPRARLTEITADFLESLSLQVSTQGYL